jgi:hypothetical protein
MVLKAHQHWWQRLVIGSGEDIRQVVDQLGNNHQAIAQ